LWTAQFTLRRIYWWYLLLLDQQRVFQEADDAEERDNTQAKEFSLNKFEDVFRAVEVVKQKIVDADPNAERSMQIHRDVDSELCVYRCMYEDLKKENAVQSTLLKYISKDDKDVFVSVSLPLEMTFRICFYLALYKCSVTLLTINLNYKYILSILYCNMSLINK
jgi:hypothetical protein